MERIEPNLVPEWLRSSGKINGVGNSAQHSLTKGCSKFGGDKNSCRGSFLDKNSLGNSHFNLSNNGSSEYPYSSFNRNPRDRNQDKEKNKFVTKDLWELNNIDPLGDILISRAEKDILRHSRLLLARKAVDIKVNGNNDRSGNYGAQNAAFDKDFPSLGNEEKYGGENDVRKVPFSDVSTAMQSLIGGEGWSSALAEVPAIIGNNIRPISVQNIVPENVLSKVSSPNMAEALSHGPPRDRISQVPDKVQMLAELAIKQSKQLIPMTPSMSKSLGHNSDKLKQLKTSKSLQPYSSQLKSEATNNTISKNRGKFLVLKPVRDNGVTHNNSSKEATNPLSDTSAATNLKSPIKASNVEKKLSTLSLRTGPFGEKKPSFSQVQSRSDFFKLMRNKFSMGLSGDVAERSAEVAEGAGGSVNGDYLNEEDKNLYFNGTVYPDEEEAAFLRSLGWDENGGEDDGLTEEEINAFYEEFMKMKPSLKLCRDVEQKITSLCESHTTGSSRASSELSLSETEIEADNM